MIQAILCRLGIHGPCTVTEYLLVKSVECQTCGRIYYDQVGL